MTSESTKQYRVHWKFTKEKKAETADFMAPSLGSLMRTVGRAYDIDTEKCDFVYVHEISPKGVPEEVFSYEHDGTCLLALDEKDEQSNVISMVGALLKRASEAKEEAPKPHIKLSHDKTETARPFVRAAYGRYVAYEATENGNG